ncbi:MAG: membrane-bound lytic murein transglycosylase D [Oceanospirillaceae bacterium]|jgi:membrane-bound lytic murein transglycosylase D
MFSKKIIAILFLISLAGCKATAVNTSYNSNYNSFDKNAAPLQQFYTNNDINNNDLWQLTRENLQFSDLFDQPRVKKEVKMYNRYPQHMSKVSKQAEPYYYYVLNEVLNRGFPSEVALLPVIESMYNPNAYSYGKASGIWQFIPSTAIYLGININNNYDGRRDLITSTKTALDYLARLNKRFDGDWMLTFAAYNGGGGTVSKAIRKNKEKGMATDYWSLNLPRETTQYVPRILAIADIVHNPRKYKIEIPTIANKPFFKVIKAKGRVDLKKIAKIARIDKSLFQKLNSGFSNNIISTKGLHRILVPVNRASSLTLALNSPANTQYMNATHYKIQPGDSLGMIAQNHGVSTRALKQVNSLSNSKIRVGKTLLIPTNNNAKSAQLASLSHKTHKINNGDTVWDIAKKHKISVNDILAFNGLSKSSTLRIGSEIKIPRG